MTPEQEAILAEVRGKLRAKSNGITFVSPRGGDIVLNPDDPRDQRKIQVLKERGWQRQPQTVNTGAKGSREKDWTVGGDAGATAADVAKSAGVGAGQAAIGTAGAPADLALLLGRGLDWLGEKAGIQPSPENIAQAEKNRAGITQMSSPAIREKVESVTGPFYQPKSRLGEIGQTTGEMAGNAVAPGGLVRKGLSVAIPTASKEVTRSLTRGTSAEDWAPDVAALVGSLGAGAGAPRTGFTQQSRNRAAAKISAEGPNVPTYDEAINLRQGLYDALENAGVRYDANEWQRFGTDLARRIGPHIDPGLHPDANRALTRIMESVAQNGSPDFTEMDILRQLAGDAMAGMLPRDRRWAGELVTELDRFAETAPLITNGSVRADQIAPLARQAREMASRVIKARRLRTADAVATDARVGDVQRLRGTFENVKNDADRHPGRLSPVERAGVGQVTRETLPRAMSVGKARPAITMGSSLALGAGLAPFLGPVAPMLGGVTAVAPYLMKWPVNRGIRRAADTAEKTMLAGRGAQTAAQQQARQNLVDMVARLGLSTILGTSNQRQGLEGSIGGGDIPRARGGYGP